MGGGEKRREEKRRRETSSRRRRFSSDDEQNASERAKRDDVRTYVKICSTHITHQPSINQSIIIIIIITPTDMTRHDKTRHDETKRNKTGPAPDDTFTQRTNSTTRSGTTARSASTSTTKYRTVYTYTYENTNERTNERRAPHRVTRRHRLTDARHETASSDMYAVSQTAAMTTVTIARRFKVRTREDRRRVVRARRRRDSVMDGWIGGWVTMAGIVQEVDGCVIRFGSVLVATNRR